MRRAPAAILLALSACAPGPASDPGDPRAGVPSPAREFRAVWVATVDNIDWPSRPGLTSGRQRLEARAILDRSRDLGLNAVVLQIRPHCDALYVSPLEPWSYYLSGRPGEPPEPPYDPLEFWVEEAHARGLELHAWLNPYRADHPANREGLAPESIASRRPDLVRTLGDSGYLWLDPGSEEVREMTLTVFLDVAERYDVDGVHLDDYFYPYPSYSGGGDFPDEPTWQAYLEDGGGLDRADWRRQNVDRFVEGLYTRLRDLPRPVKLGISPFGVWRPGHPPSVRAGVDQYGMLFADPRRWLHEGWLDYCAPQLYWPISKVPQSFPVLLAWWARNNPHGRHVWPGLFTSSVAERGWAAREIVDQIMVTRGLLDPGPGHIHFSARAVLDSGRVGARGNRLNAALAKGPYRGPALAPATPWLDDEPPGAPAVKARVGDGELLLDWSRPEGEAPFLYVVYTKGRGTGWRHRIVPAARTELRLPHGEAGEKSAVEAVAVTSVDRMGNESELHAHTLESLL